MFGSPNTKDRKLILAMVVFLAFPELAFARRIRNEVLLPFALVIKEKTYLVEELEPDYKELGSFWSEKIGEEKKLEKIYLLLEISNLLKESMIFDEENFKGNHPDIWKEIETAKEEIKNTPDKTDIIISNLLWEQLIEEEKRIFKVVATRLRGNHQELLFQYIKEINSYFLVHLLDNPLEQSRIRDSFSSQLKGIGIEPEYYLKKWLPEISRKIIEFVEEGEILPDEGWDEYVNLIKKLPVILKLLKEKQLFSQSLAGFIFRINLELAGELDKIKQNFDSVEKLVLRFPQDTSLYSPSLLRSILESSFKFSEGLSGNYQICNLTIASIISQINEINMFSTKLLINLMRSAEKSAERFEIYVSNLEKIRQFIACLIPFRYTLAQKGKDIRDVLENEIIKIADRSGSDYLLFQKELLNLRINLTGIKEFRQEEIQRIEKIVEAFKRIEEEFEIEKINKPHSLIPLLKEIIGPIQTVKTPQALEEIIHDYISGNLSISSALDFNIHTPIGEINLYKPEYEPGLVSFKLSLLHLLGQINIEEWAEKGITPANVYRLLGDFYQEKGMDFKSIQICLQDWILDKYYFNNEVLRNLAQYRDAYGLYLYVNFLRENGAEETNLEKYRFLRSEEEIDLLNWREEIDLELEVIEKYKDEVTEEKINSYIEKLLSKHIRPSISSLAEEMGISGDILIGISYINNMDLATLVDFPEIEEILDAARPLTEREIKYFLSLANINGLYLDEIVKKFLILDELGRVKTINRDELNEFIYGEDFRKIGDLIFSPAGFKRFIEDIYHASCWVEVSFRVLGPRRYELFGLKPEELGRYGEIIAISRNLFRIRGDKKFPLPDPFELQAKKWKVYKHKIPYFLSRLFISGRGRFDAERGVYLYRIIDERGDIIAEFDKIRNYVVTSIFVRDETRTVWGRWDPKKEEYDQEPIPNDSSLGKFLNEMVENCYFIVK